VPTGFTQPVNERDQQMEYAPALVCAAHKSSPLYLHLFSSQDSSCTQGKGHLISNTCSRWPTFQL